MRQGQTYAKSMHSVLGGNGHAGIIVNIKVDSSPVRSLFTQPAGEVSGLFRCNIEDSAIV
jgi:hypothetical protein